MPLLFFLFLLSTEAYSGSDTCFPDFCAKNPSYPGCPCNTDPTSSAQNYIPPITSVNGKQISGDDRNIPSPNYDVNGTSDPTQLNQMKPEEPQKEKQRRVPSNPNNSSQDMSPYLPLLMAPALMKALEPNSDGGINSIPSPKYQLPDQTDTGPQPKVADDPYKPELEKPGLESPPDINKGPGNCQAAPLPVQTFPPGVPYTYQYSGSPEGQHPEARVVAFDFQIYGPNKLAQEKARVAALKAQGKRVICYFSTQYENWREDMGGIKGSVKGALGDWQGEGTVDTNNQKLRSVIMERLERAKQIGCDGVDPDNTDQEKNESKKNEFLRFLSSCAHAKGLAIGLKNNAEWAKQNPQLATQMFDFAVVEQCGAQGLCSYYKAFPNSKKAVYEIEYNNASSKVCDEAKSLSFDPIFINNGIKKMNGEFTRCGGR